MRGAQDTHVFGVVAAAAELHFPCSQGVQLAAGILDHVPAEQLVHVAEPGSAKDPTGHVKQTALVVAPIAFENLPARQLVHATPAS